MEARADLVGVREAGGAREGERLRDTVPGGEALAAGVGNAVRDGLAVVVPVTSVGDTLGEGDVVAAGVGYADRVGLDDGVPVTTVGVPLGEGEVVGNAVPYADRDGEGVPVAAPVPDEATLGVGDSVAPGVPVAGLGLLLGEGVAVGGEVGKAVREGLPVGVPVTAVPVPLGEGVAVAAGVGYADREADGVPVVAPVGDAVAGRDGEGDDEGAPASAVLDKVAAGVELGVVKAVRLTVPLLDPREVPVDVDVPD